MTASAERAARPVPDDLPPALSSMWRLVRLGYRHEPRWLVWSFLLSLAAALPDALLALWLALLGRGVLEGDRRLLAVAATGLALSAAGTWVLRTVNAASATGSRSPSRPTSPASRRRWRPSPTRSGPSGWTA
jgi:hypothetical protein